MSKLEVVGRLLEVPSSHEDKEGTETRFVLRVEKVLQGPEVSKELRIVLIGSESEEFLKSVYKGSRVRIIGAHSTSRFRLNGNPSEEQRLFVQGISALDRDTVSHESEHFERRLAYNPAVRQKN